MDRKSNDIQRHAVVAIIQKSDRFLFVKRADHLENAPGYWCPVSGHVEGNELQQEAVKREVKEEVGLDIVAHKNVCSILSHDNRYRLHFWTTKILSGEATITSDEVAALRWVTLDEMKQLTPVFDEDVQVFERFTGC
jgi:8-oxo-dGTP diphosphatase